MSDFARLTAATLRRDLAAAAPGRGGGNTIRRTTGTLVAAVALVVVPALLSAHEVTHNGTVVALKTAKYAQPSGGTREVRELEVAVVDPKTKCVNTIVFSSPVRRASQAAAT